MSTTGPASILNLFEDLAILTMTQWQEVTLQQLHDDHGIQMGTIHPSATDLAVAVVDDCRVAVRYVWTLAGSVQMIDVHVFTFSSDESDQSFVERHYRVRAIETVT